jgi:hypothetical protein
MALIVREGLEVSKRRPIGNHLDRAPVNVDDMSRQQTAPAVNCRLNEKTRPKYIEQW